MKYLIATEIIGICNAVDASRINYEIVVAPNEETALAIYSKRHKLNYWLPKIMAKYDEKTLFIVNEHVELSKLKMLNPNIKIR